MSTAVPITSASYDPRNPNALGYDADSPAFAEASRQAGGDPALATAFDATLRRETARFRAWTAEYRRQGSGGVGFSGASLGPFVPALPAALLAEARESVAAGQARRERRAAFWSFTREMLSPPALEGGPSASLKEG